jgi:hypothetical protein
MRNLIAMLDSRPAPVPDPEAWKLAAAAWTMANALAAEAAKEPAE